MGGLNMNNEELERNFSWIASAYEYKDYLTEENKVLLARTIDTLARIPNDSYIGKTKSMYGNKLYEMAKQNNGEGLEIAEIFRQSNPMDVNDLYTKDNDGPKLALVKKESSYPLSSKAAFINVAILLYGILNIGFIVAVALMK